jgi:hypothetical protein
MKAIGQLRLTLRINQVLKLAFQLLLSSLVNNLDILADLRFDAAELPRIQLPFLSLLCCILSYFVETQREQIAILLHRILFLLSSFFMRFLFLTLILIGTL